MSKIYWNRMEEIPVVGPLSPGRIGVLENKCGDVVGFIVIEFLGPRRGVVTCRKIWEEFSMAIQFELIPNVFPIVSAQVVKNLFGKELVCFVV